MIAACLYPFGSCLLVPLSREIGQLWGRWCWSVQQLLRQTRRDGDARIICSLACLWVFSLACVASKANEWTDNQDLVRSLWWHGRTSWKSLASRVSKKRFAAKVWRNASLRYHFYGLVSWNERIQDDPSQRPNQRPRVDTWQHRAWKNGSTFAGGVNDLRYFEIFKLL